MIVGTIVRTIVKTIVGRIVYTIVETISISDIRDNSRNSRSYDSREHI